MPLRWLCSCCCSCARGESDEVEHTNEVDYLLPGGEWDPSVSASSNRHRKKRSLGRPRTRRSSANETFSVDNEDNDETASTYVPPEVPGTSSMPTFQDFTTLKTVGKGAFGKVAI